MFSQRFTWSLDLNPLTRALRERRAAGLAVDDLTVANPGAAGFAWDAAALASLYAHPDAAYYDPDPRGMPAARAEVARYYADRAAAVSPDDLRLCASTSEGYGWLLKLLTEPGDEVLVPEPSYPLFDYITAMERVVMRAWPFSSRDGAWRVDADALDAAITSRTRAIVAVSPNNPTGSVLSVEDRDTLRRVARRRGLPLIVDEVFLDYPAGWPDDAPATFARERDIPVFVLSGLSKVALAPQAKLAWIVVAGPESFRAEAGERLDHIADTYLSVSTAVQLAAGALIDGAAPLRARLRERCETNDRTLRRWAAASGDAVVVEPREAGWYASLVLPAGVEEERATLALLNREGVLAHPGHFFGYPAGRARWIVSLLTPPDVIDRATGAFDRTLRHV